VRLFVYLAEPRYGAVRREDNVLAHAYVLGREALHGSQSLVRGAILGRVELAEARKHLGVQIRQHAAQQRRGRFRIAFGLCGHHAIHLVANLLRGMLRGRAASQRGRQRRERERETAGSAHL
jgi:hypothetical protein